MPGPDAAAIERAYRESSGRAVATLIRLFGDIDLAEEAVQEAFAVAAQRWPATGVPPNPGGWIVTTARRKALDRLRRESSRSRPARRRRSCCTPTPRPDGGGTRARRPPAADLHLLSSGPGGRGPDRSHPAAHRGAPDARDRPCLPRARGDGCPAPGPGQAEDPGRRHSLPGARATRSCPTGCPSCLRSSTSCSTRDIRRRPAMSSSAPNCARRPSASPGCWPS